MQQLAAVHVPHGAHARYSDAYESVEAKFWGVLHSFLATFATYSLSLSRCERSQHFFPHTYHYSLRHKHTYMHLKLLVAVFIVGESCFLPSLCDTASCGPAIYSDARKSIKGVMTPENSFVSQTFRSPPPPLSLTHLG